MGRDRGVANETSFVMRVEKTDTQVVVAAIPGLYEGSVGVVQFAGKRLHFGIGEDLGAEDNACRIAGEQRLGERVYLENSDLT